MSKQDHDEIRDIADQLREHLKFYREIGITNLDCIGRPDQASRAGFRGAAPERGEPADVIPTQPQILPEDLEASQKSGAVIVQASLFGEAAVERPSRSAPAASYPVERRDASLEVIREDIGDCRRCRLHEHRTKIVFGEGNPKARLMFIGEGPGADEDISGRPFVGRAGQLLDKIIASIGLRREDVYIANIVKCRPPENRTPERDEVTTCEPFVFRQIAVIKPAVIVALGSPAFQCILRTREPITKVRGEWRDWNGIKVMPTFHPAYLLRVPDRKRETWDDMKKVRDYLNRLTA